MATTVFDMNGFPKVGIRPIIDGRRRGVRESLETQTMNMAQTAAQLISANLRYPDGSPVQCVIADTTIGGRTEAAQCANKFRDQNVGVSLSVTPCWCYGTETMDLDPTIPKAVWGFNGTERPGAVYLACMLAGYAQRGMPAYGIYGREVQDATDTRVPDDVKEKILRFVKAGLAVALMKGKSYLSVGSSAMGIAGSFVDVDFFQDYLGLAPENMDMCEIERRIAEGIYDKDEYAKARAWVKRNCTEGKDYNPKAIQKSRAAKDADWDYVVKMAMIMRDMMVGNPKLAERGFGEEAVGRNAIAGGFQGQRQWTDHWPNGDFMEAFCNSSFDWNGPKMPQVVATENDSLNGVCMLLMWLLTNKASMFADVRTYWSDASVKRATGKGLKGRAKAGIIHLLNSGSCCLDAAGEMKERGKRVFKNWWDVTAKDIDATMKATKWVPAGVEILPRRRLFELVPDAGGPAAHDDAHLLREGTGPRAPDRGRLVGRARQGPAGEADAAHQPRMALHLVRAAPHRQGRVQGRLFGDERLGREPRRDRLRPHRRGLDHACRAAAHPRRAAQRAGGAGLPSALLGALRRVRRPDGRRLPRVQELRPALRHQPLTRRRLRGCEPRQLFTSLEN